MPKNAISKISNSFSTGGGGTHFEDRVQAMFLLSLLVEGFFPAINEQTKRVCFQAKHLGFDVDDVVVFTYRNKKEGKILCQIKHSIIATENNEIFKDVIASAWTDFNKEGFDKGNDKIALITAQISKESSCSLRFLHEEAKAAVDENDFYERVSQSQFASDADRKMFATLKKCIKEHTSGEPPLRDLWLFLKTFLLLLFDLDYEESINRALSLSLIKHTAVQNPKMVWARLVEYAGQCNQTASSINLENIDKDIYELFKKENAVINHQMMAVESDLFTPIVAMIGSWNKENEKDTQIIEIISGMDYSDFENKVKNLAQVGQLVITHHEVNATDAVLLQREEIARSEFTSTVFARVGDRFAI